MTRDDAVELIKLWAGAVPFIALASVFYPPVWTYMDESVYIGLANVLRHGTLFADQAGIQIPYVGWNGHHLVSQYPYGMPALIALASVVSWKAIFLINPAAWLIGFAAFAKWLRLEGVSRRYAWLYLYFPTAVFYTRTVMSEIVCGAVITLAGLAYRQERFVWTGLWLGLAINIRSSLGVILPALLVASALEWLWAGKSWRAWLAAGPGWRIVAGALPGLLAVLVTNFATTGHPLRSPYALSVGHVLSVTNLIPNLARFGESLVVVYPLMALSVFLGPWRGRLAPRMAIVVFILFHALVPTGWVTGNQWDSLAQRLVLQQRYLLPILPFLLLFYVMGLDRAMRAASWSPPKLLVAAAAALVLAAGAMQIRHDRYLQTLAEFQRIVYRTVPEGASVVTNFDALKLVNDIRGKRSWVLVTHDSVDIPATEPPPTFYVEILHSQGRRPDEKFGPLLPGETILLERVERGGSTLSIYRYRGAPRATS
jgi:hypothetical protein